MTQPLRWFLEEGNRYKNMTELAEAVNRHNPATYSKARNVTTHLSRPLSRKSDWSEPLWRCVEIAIRADHKAVVADRLVESLRQSSGLATVREFLRNPNNRGLALLTMEFDITPEQFNVVLHCIDVASRPLSKETCKEILGLE